MQALMMRSEWFAVGRGGEEGPKEEHFLWPLGLSEPLSFATRIMRRCEQRDLEAEQKQQQKQRRQELEAESHAKLMELMLEIKEQMMPVAMPSKGSVISSTYMSKRNTDEKPQTRVRTAASNQTTPTTTPRRRLKLAL